jgi:hypothetical protein
MSNLVYDIEHNTGNCWREFNFNAVSGVADPNIVWLNDVQLFKGEWMLRVLNVPQEIIHFIFIDFIVN